MMYEIVNQNCVNPADVKRKIPFLEIATDEQVGAVVAAYQKTGGEVYDSLTSLAGNADIGFNAVTFEIPFSPSIQSVFTQLLNISLSYVFNTSPPSLFIESYRDWETDRKSVV